MKTEYINNEKFIVYLNKYIYKFDKKTIEDYMYKILKIISKKYNLDIYSYFNIKCYIYDKYGIVLVIKRENDPFSKYTKNVNLNINFYEDIFLFEVSDYFVSKKIKCNVYEHKNKYYLDIKDDDYLSISEHINKIIFGEDAFKIVN